MVHLLLLVAEGGVGGGPGTSLEFVVPPIGAPSGQLLTQQPVIRVKDNITGLTKTDDTRQVTVSIVPVGAGNGVLYGTVTRNAVNGIVEHTDLFVLGQGDYSMKAQ